MKAFILSAFVSVLPAVAKSQNVIGTATGTVEGVEHEWFFTEMDGHSQSTYSVTGPFIEVVLFGHATADTTMASLNGIVVDWTTVEGVVPDWTPAGLHFMPETSYMKAYEDAEDQPVTLDLVTYDMSGDGLHIVGSASGTLLWTDRPGYPGDPDNTKEVTVSFDVTLPPAD